MGKIGIQTIHSTVYAYSLWKTNLMLRSFTQGCRNTLILPLKKKRGWVVLHRLPNPLTIEASIPFYGIFSVFLELDTSCWLSHHSQVAVSSLS